MIKKIGSCLLLSIGLFSCSEQAVTIRSEHEPFDVREYLQSLDSLACWTVQYRSEKDLTADRWWGTSVVYLGVYLMTPDSLYQFTYPCDLWRTSTYNFHGNKLLIPGAPSRKFYCYGDTLETAYEIPYEVDASEDSITLAVREIYVKQNVNAAALLDLINFKHNAACDTMRDRINLNELKHFENLIDKIDF